MQYQEVAGGICAPKGFAAAGVHCGIRANHTEKYDLALIKADVRCAAAGVYTTNKVCGAPIKVDRAHLKDGYAQAILVNSGNANTCAANGVALAEECCELVGKALDIDAMDVLPASTGVIGQPMVIDPFARGIPAAAAKLAAAEQGSTDAATAIMTTDTKPKEIALSFGAGNRKVTIGGMCKGAGMIAPKMTVPHATMLCYITTDCAISNELLGSMLGEIVDDSFNKVTVDGDMSTNDTVVVMANGASGVEIRNGSPEAEHFKVALTMVAQHLARAIAMDGEGATKFVSVEVRGAATSHDAEMCARTVANSLLCKTAWFGCDPNWGRVLAAAGRSGANFSAENVSLDYDEMPVVRNGMDAGTPETELAQVMKRGEFTIKLDLGEGHGTFTVWTSDVSYEYVKINADYHT